MFISFMICIDVECTCIWFSWISQLCVKIFCKVIHSILSKRVYACIGETMSAGVIITGASGMLGRAVCQELKKNAPSWLVQGLAWSRATGDLIKVDVTNRSSVHELFQRLKVND